MVALLSIVGVRQANAYTVSDLTSAGWTQVTDLSALTLSNNYFVLVDAGASATAMTLGNPATNDKPSYTTLADPFAASQQVWIIEDGYKLKSMVSEKYFNSGSAGWNGSMSDTGTDLTFTLNAGKYKISCATGYAGPWNNDGSVKLSDGYENVALNKSDAQAPGFYIYNISRTAYNAARRNGAALVAEGWLKVTATDRLGVSGNYYALLDVSEAGYESGFAMTGATNGRPQSQALTNPATNKAQTWIIAPHDADKFVLQCAQDNKYFYCNGAGWNTGFIDNIDADGTDFTFTLNDGKWTLANEKDASNFVGRWGNSAFHPFQGESIAANKAAGSGKKFYLIYSIPSAVETATPLPNTGDMAADTWYYFDNDVAGEYNMTATNLGDISYYISSAPAISSSFTAVSTLSQARYYVKSVAANNLVITPHGYSYAVGDATLSIADGKYTQSKTFTATFDAATTNDPAGEFQILDASKITVNGAAATASLTDKVLTVTLADPLAVSTNYAISVAAGAVGYKADAANDAITLTVHTPAVFDGIFFIKQNDVDKYVSRGGNDNTEAILDSYGIPVQITTDAENVSLVKFMDNNRYLYAGSTSVYSDKELAAGGNNVKWTIASYIGGYSFYNSEREKYMAAGVGAEEPHVPAAIRADAAYAWTLEATSAHPAKMQAVKDAQAASAASAAGLSASTQAELKTYLSENYGETNIAITGVTSVADQFQQRADKGNGSKKTFITETKTGLSSGLYRLRVNAFERIAGLDAVLSAGGAPGLAYVYANDQKIQLCSLAETYKAGSAWSSGSPADISKPEGYYVNNTTSADAAFDAGYYVNDVYIYLDTDDSSIEFGIETTNSYGEANNSQWICYNNFSLVKFDAKPTTEEKTALATAISTAEGKTLGFEKDKYAPYNNVDALTKLAEAKAVNPETASGSAVVAATTALTGATWTANATDVDAVFNGSFSSDVDGDWGLTGWTRTNAWGQQRNDLPNNCGSNTNYGYYNQPGSLKYGNTGAYIMPLKANTIYNLTFKYASWATDSNNGMTVSVLNGEEGMAAMAFPENNTQYDTSGAFAVKTLVFATGAAGNYVLTLANSGNTVITDVSITKAASQVLEFADGSVPAYAPGTYPSVKITRELTKDKWASAIYPFAVSATGLTVATLSSFEDSQLDFSTANPSTANKPFLMKSASDLTEISLSDVAVVAAAASPVVEGDVTFTGVYSSTPIDDSAVNYVLSDNKLYKVGTAGATMNPYRAYFTVAGASLVKPLSFVVDGTATGVDSVEAVEAEEDGVLYNTAGQQVTEDYKGIVIKNGKKYLNK